MPKNKYFMGFLTLLLILIVVLIVVLSMGMTAIVSNNNAKIEPNAALSTESGKAVFVGNYELNVSWKLFNSQTTGKVFYSQSSAITDKTANVSFTTANYTILSGLEIGTYYILIQNGSTFPALTYEFTGNIPVSSVLEAFNVNYIGNNQFNVSWNKFNSQTVVRIYYAFGNASNLTSASNFFIGSALPYLIITFNNLTSKNVNFLLVNDSLFPKGEVNYTSFIVISSMHSHNGLLIAFDGYGFFFSYIALMLILAVIIVIVILAKHEHNKRE
jgi:hypothetical protein